LASSEEGNSTEIKTSFGSSTPRRIRKRIESDFHENQGRVAKSLRKKGALRSGLGVGRATDILWALNHPDVYQLLVGRRGWTPAQYEKWLGDAFCSEVLGPSTSRKRSA
jgi:hypothetical protein